MAQRENVNVLECVLLWLIINDLCENRKSKKKSRTSTKGNSGYIYSGRNQSDLFLHKCLIMHPDNE